MTRRELEGIFRGCDASELAEIQTALQGVVEEKRPKVDISQIRIGMSADESARVRAEIARVAKEIGQ